MPRNLDLTALRAFVAVADAGGVTRAATQLNFTQSAVSMQLKRLEESLGMPLFDRSGRKLGLSAQGEQLLGSARRMLELNDDAWARMTRTFKDEIAIGATHETMGYASEAVLRLAQICPQVRSTMHEDLTFELKHRFARGELDLILTTEPEVERGGEVMRRRRLVWVGAENGHAWRARPVRFGSAARCVFRRPAIEALEEAGVPWKLTVEAASYSGVETAVTADLAVFVQLAGSIPAGCEEIRHGGALPVLPDCLICMYVDEGPRKALAERLAGFIREGYEVDRVPSE